MPPPPPPPPAPIVVIEMSAADRASPLAETLVRACSDSVVEGRCFLVGDANDPPPPTSSSSSAVVSWIDRDHRVVEVSVGLQGSERGRWLSRKIEFREDDAPKERWRAVGLVIAALVGETHRARESEPTSPPAPATPPTPTHEPEKTRPVLSVPRQPPSSEIFWLDGGGLFDPGFGDTWARYGGWLRGSWRPSSTMPLFVLGSGRFATTPGEVDDGGLTVQWVGLSAGAGTFFPIGGGGGGSSSFPKLRVELHADFIAELIRASATMSSSSGASQTRERWVAGGRAAAEIVWSPAAAASWALVAGIDETLRSTGTVLRLSGERRGREPQLDTNLLVGARAIFR